jgi:hypothetical protein
VKEDTERIGISAITGGRVGRIQRQKRETLGEITAAYEKQES